MKRKMTRVITAVLALCTALSTAVFAADSSIYSQPPKVRINGQIVEFPDAQPFIDENSRTLMPVRFVIEALGAEASWDNDTQTATIKKDDTCIIVAISSPYLEVSDGNVSYTVIMDTCAVLKDSRTFVPIRFIAEALGAYVDYSDVHHTACIYSDVLTAEQIAKLQAYEYTQPEVAVSYEDYLAKHTAEKTAQRYGTDRDTFDNFANAREHLYYTNSRASTYYFGSTNTTLTGSNPDTFFQMVAKEAAGLIAYKSERLTVEFLTDTSCIYQPDDIDSIGCAVRGIAVVTLNVSPLELKGAETAMLVNMGFNRLYSDVTMYIDLDVHMNTMSMCAVDINTIVPLCNAY